MNNDKEEHKPIQPPCNHIGHNHSAGCHMMNSDDAVLIFTTMYCDNCGDTWTSARMIPLPKVETEPDPKIPIPKIVLPKNPKSN